MSPRPSASGSTRSMETVRNALRDAKIGYTGLDSQGDAIVVHDPRSGPDRRRAAGARQARPDLAVEIAARRGRHDALQHGRDRDAPPAGGRRSRSRSSAAASTRPAPRSRRSSARARTASWCSSRASTIRSTSRRCSGRTAKLTFQLVDTSVTVEEARRGRLPPGDEILPAQEERGSRGGPTAVCRAQARHGRRRHAGRRAGHLPGQRAGRQLQVRCRRRPPLRRRDARECRQAVRDRARQQGDQRAGHPRADPRRQRHHLRQLHGAVGQRSGAAAARRRLAGADHDSRGAHGRGRARRRFDPRRSDREHRRR